MRLASFKTNMIWVVAEFASVTAIQLLVMRYIVGTLGTAQMGLWAVLMAAAQVAGFFDFGLPGGISRYLARAHAKGLRDDIEKVIAIVVFVTIPFYLLVSAAIYAIMYVALPAIVQADMLAEARAILPFSSACYFLLVISLTCSGCLTGLHLGFRKSQLVMTGMVVQGILSWIWIGQRGLVGLAHAQIVGYCFVLAGAFVLLKFSGGVRLRRLFRFDATLAREVIRFGAGLQISSIAWAGFETSIRFLMSRFGGAALLGQYEIAYRLANQPRVLFVYIAQPLGPALVNRAAEGRAAFAAFYRLTYARFSLGAAAVAVGVILTSPLAAWIMLGGIHSHYLLFAALTAIGAAIHIWAMPVENAAVAQGVLRYNAIGTISALVVMLVLGIPAGWLFGGEGVAVSVLCASATAGLFPVLANSRKLQLDILPDWRAGLAGLMPVIWRQGRA